MPLTFDQLIELLDKSISVAGDSKSKKAFLADIFQPMRSPLDSRAADRSRRAQLADRTCEDEALYMEVERPRRFRDEGLPAALLRLCQRGAVIEQSPQRESDCATSDRAFRFSSSVVNAHARSKGATLPSCVTCPSACTV